MTTATATRPALVAVRPLAPRDLDDVVAIDAALGRRPRRLYVERRLAAALRELDRIVRAAAIDVATELLDYEEQARLVDYEVGLEVFRRVKQGTGKTVAEPEPEVPVGSRQVYYRFEGEYWNDELHDYRYRIDDRCFGTRLIDPAEDER